MNIDETHSGGKWIDADAEVALSPRLMRKPRKKRPRKNRAI
jgi:hypothetical protein